MRWTASGLTRFSAVTHMWRPHTAAKETARLTKEMDKLGKEIKKLNGKLRNEGFLKKAPAQVVEGERTKLAGYEEKMKSLEARLADLKKL